MLDTPLALTPKAAHRVWGGQRIAKKFHRNFPEDQPIGESWEVHGDLEVASGPQAGETLNTLLHRFGERLVGRRNRGCSDFPLLTKWLDCHDWLSVQVHPDDPLARELTGDPSARGKSEAWYVVEAEEGSELIHGLVEGVTGKDVLAAKGAEVLPLVARRRPRAGQLLFTPAGTIHALGPGAFIYEVQQSSDLTYRLYDWGRDRPIHPAQAGRCAAEAVPPRSSEQPDTVSCRYFSIELKRGDSELDLNGETFVIAAAVEGGARLAGRFGSCRMNPGDTLLLPASLGVTTLEAEGTLLLASVPEAS